MDEVSRTQAENYNRVQSPPRLCHFVSLGV
jgi:hypothetical protein